MQIQEIKLQMIFSSQDQIKLNKEIKQQAVRKETLAMGKAEKTNLVIIE
jgi:hypothetical protein